jgi:hypothetical protein
MNRVRGQDRRDVEFGAPCGFLERRERAERRRIEVIDGSIEEFESLMAAMNARRGEMIDRTISDWALALRRDK